MCIRDRYRTLKRETVNGETKWKESAISTMRLKSFIARVSSTDSGHNIFGVVLHDGTPINSVEVKIDDGPWQPATLDPETAREKYGWKFFNYTWNGATSGEHTVTSRATDANGVVQPTAEELDFELGGVKQTFLEHNAQLTRPVIIA